MGKTYINGVEFLQVSNYCSKKYLLSYFLWVSSSSAGLYAFNFVLYLCILLTKIGILIVFLSSYSRLLRYKPSQI